MEIIILIENVCQNFKPDLVMLRMLMNKVSYLYGEAIKPLGFDLRVRFLFTPAIEFEFHSNTGFFLPVERVSVTFYPKWVNGRVEELPMIKDFLNQAGEIAYLTRTFLSNSNNNDLRLPAFITVDTGSTAYPFPIEIK